jgi:prepilin-type N-terminal cleavage/methylation domain-containing protein
MEACGHVGALARVGKEGGRPARRAVHPKLTTEEVGTVIWRRKGFTLIELLVVIAIIGILAAMLFPVFARARESARKIQCLSNVKNIALAFQMYFRTTTARRTSTARAHATSTRIPGGFHPTSSDGYCNRLPFGNPYLRWPVILDEYIKNRDVWRCPSAEWHSGANWIVGAPNGNWLAWLQSHEGMWGRNQSDPDCYGGPCCVGWPAGWGGAVSDSITQRALAADGQAPSFRTSAP